MIDNKPEKLSSLMDNEQCSDEQLIEVLNVLSSSETAIDAWQNYHLIGDALRDDFNHSISVDVSKNIAKAIANEPTVFSPKNTNVTANTNSSSNVSDGVQVKNKPTNLLTFKAKVTQFVKPFGQMAVAASAAGLMIFSVQNSNDSPQDFESVIPSSVVQTMPFGGFADPVSFNYSTQGQNNEVASRRVNHLAKDKTLNQQARIEQKRRFQALLIDHQQQIKLSQYSSTVSEK